MGYNLDSLYTLLPQFSSGRGNLSIALNKGNWGNNESTSAIIMDLKM